MAKLILYFFSNYLLFNMGITLLSPVLFKSKEEYDSVKDKIIPVSVKVLLGSMGIFVSIIILIFPYDQTVLLGDLFPAICLLINSVLLLFQYIKISPYIESDIKIVLEEYLLNIQIPFSIISLFTGILHVCFPNIILI